MLHTHVGWYITTALNCVYNEHVSIYIFTFRIYFLSQSAYWLLSALGIMEKEREETD